MRELENAIEQALVFCEGEALDVADFPAPIVGQGRGAGTPTDAAPKLPPTPNATMGIDLPPEGISLPDAMDALERELVTRAYEQAKGVKTETARLLGIKPTSIYYKLEKYGLLKPGEK